MQGFFMRVTYFEVDDSTINKLLNKKIARLLNITELIIHYPKH